MIELRSEAEAAQVFLNWLRLHRPPKSGEPYKARFALEIETNERGERRIILDTSERMILANAALNPSEPSPT